MVAQDKCCWYEQTAVGAQRRKHDLPGRTREATKQREKAVTFKVIWVQIWALLLAS